MIKAVFFDIDGTLVSFKTHQVPQSTIDALDVLRKKGIKVFISTGRQLHSINNLGTLEFDGYITLNGSRCYAEKNRLIFEQAIPDEDIRSLIEYQNTVEQFPCVYVMDNETLLNYKNEDVDRLFALLNFPEPPIGDVSYLQGKTVYQLIAFFTVEQESCIMASMPHCRATRWNPLFSDVVPSNSNKAIGIDHIIRHYGISLDETMAFGDGGNDKEMLQHAGIGVAMGNSLADVQAVADYVTTSVDEDGVSHALKHFGLI